MRIRNVLAKVGAVAISAFLTTGAMVASDLARPDGHPLKAPIHIDALADPDTQPSIIPDEWDLSEHLTVLEAIAEAPAPTRVTQADLARDDDRDKPTQHGSVAVEENAGKPTTPTGEPRESTYLFANAKEAVTIASSQGSNRFSVTAYKGLTPAPNLPLYLSLVCDGRTVASSSENIVGTETIKRTFSGTGDCSLRGSTAQPSSKWSQDENKILVSVSVSPLPGGSQVTASASGVSVLATKDKPGVLAIDIPRSTATGTFQVKLTGCSSAGGSSDETLKNGCDGHVIKGRGSKVKVSIIDPDGGVADSRAEFISADKHHATVDIPVAARSGSWKIEVQLLEGPSVIVHQPTSRFSGLA